ncbi:metal ABC transporter ATP-binding protein [Peptoanaerobacter stomatis]|uniref:ABC transporter domain-containing protein n=1 Tax=Peptoanaerobacter stomatis TaxID=796937 RepID=G9XCB6_9FIRM|nr:metal ABC transporter ATP-binding protein [Peptoanaerobacter stomatis]EHL19413.1 hypothetical protein HMPREF9628_01493 [Peptoanaerobacter stomatis]
MNAVKVEDLTVAYGKTPVLWDIDANFEENKITAIIGPNGAGKSTLLKSILGFIKPVAGSIKIFGNDIDKSRLQVAYVPQSNSVNWDFPINVQDVVLMGRYRSIGLIKTISKDEKQKALNALEQMDLLDLKNRQISQLSGGQKQRVFIARALCQDAKLLIMDEPLAGVDKVSEKIIMNKVKNLKKDGKTIICVHHDLNTIKEYFDNIVMINKFFVAGGDINNYFTKENIDKTYKEVAYDI